MLHQTGDYSLVQIMVGDQANIIGSSLKDTDFIKQDVNVLAIEREGISLPQPALKEQLQAGDRLICYGKSHSIDNIVGKYK